MSKVVCLGIGSFFALTSLAFMKVNRAEEDPIFDEIFHIPQCQNWCKGNFTIPYSWTLLTGISSGCFVKLQWDNTITTLPGLYVLAGGFLKTLEGIGYLLDPCTTFNLRLGNLILNTLSACICYLIFGQKFPDISDGKKMASALVCASTPLLWFYSFMFYTEPPATFFLLLMHYFWMKKSYSWSAFMGGCTVVTRQSNIVWVLMHGLLTLTSVLENHKQFFHTLQKQLGSLGKLVVYKIINCNAPEVTSCLMDTTHQISQKKSKGQRIKQMGESKSVDVPNSLIIRQGVALADELLMKCSGYLVAGLAFCIFVKLNEGIVVGDRESHEVNINSPQILYFSLFVGILSLPSVFSGKGKRTWDFICNNLCITLAIYFLFFLLVHYNTVGHRYNLVYPNHHTTHYFLNAVYHEPNRLRYFLLPFYTFFWTFICINLAQSMGKVATGFFVLITCLNLIPQLLLEFRYFVPAFLFFRLNLRFNSWKVLIGELVLLNSINLITVAVLIHRLVEFPPEASPKIFIW